MLTFRDADVREKIALSKCRVSSASEIWGDEAKEQIYHKFMFETPMCGTITDELNPEKKVKGIEDYLGHGEYTSDAHKEKVVEDICENFIKLSKNRKFHGIFAASSINEAIDYYYLFREKAPHLNVTGLFDPSIDNNGESSVKADGLVEIYKDYNAKFGQDYTLASSDRFKKDVATRLAHKDHYRGIEKTPEKHGFAHCGGSNADGLRF